MKKIIDEELRQLVLERDEYKCRECGDEEGLEIHHVLPEKFGGRTEANNLVVLCRECHSTKHIEYQTKYFDDLLRKFTNFWLQFVGKQLKEDVTPVLFLLTKQSQFRKYQREVIEDVIKGKDVLFVSPTGSGKSVCFQIPGIILENMSLVIAPLKALMKDQTEELWRKRIPATFVNSDLDKEEKLKRIALINKGLFKFLYIAPEQFYNEYRNYELKSDHLLLKNKYDLFVVDEAHCVDKWGRHFRPPYAMLNEVKELIGNPRTIALTATASKRVQEQIVNSLEMKNPSVYVTGFYRPEITLYDNVFQGNKEEVMAEKAKYILNIVKKFPKTKTIIFVPTVNVGKYLWKELVKNDVNTEFFYGKMHREDKIRIQNEYKGVIDSPLKVLICTSAFGMGINIKDIRIAIHWTIPENIEDYYQQMGRIGRDGEKSMAILLYAKGDENLIRFITEKSLENSKKHLTSEERKQIRQIEEEELQTMLRYVGAINKWRFILDYFGDQSLDSTVKSKINQNEILAYLIILLIAWIVFRNFWTGSILTLAIFILRNRRQIMT